MEDFRMEKNSSFLFDMFALTELYLLVKDAIKKPES